MQAISTRLNKPSDSPLLTRLWQSAFGDETDLIRLFLAHFGQPGNAIVLEYMNKVVGFVFLLPIDGMFIPKKLVEPICLTYALAIDPDYRGCGFGVLLMEQATKEINNRGFHYTALWPANHGLFTYYSKNSGFFDFFQVRESVIQVLNKSAAPMQLYNADSMEYRKFRNAFLKKLDIPFLMFSEREISYAKEVSVMLGGGCVLFGHPDPWGCAICEKNSLGELLVKELLCPENRLREALSLLSGQYSALTLHIRTPAVIGVSLGGAVRAAGQIHVENASVLSAAYYTPYYGLAFD